MRKERLDVKAICELIWELENKYDLLNLKISGVFVWQYIRVQVYYYIAERAGVFIAPHVQPTTRLSGIKKVLKYLSGALFHNPFTGSKKNVEQIIIEHPRSVDFSGKYRDIYSFFYIKELQANGQTYSTLDRADLSAGHRKEYDPLRKYIDIFPVIVALAHLFYKRKVKTQDTALIGAISEEISREIAASVDLTDLIIPAILKFKVNYRLYRMLFKKIKPNKLVILVGYAYGDAIRAAKDLSIETVELQHGTYSYYHLGYSYPDYKRELEYFPDKFVVWGEYWKDMKVLPIPDENIIVGGFPYYNCLKNEYTHVKKKGNLIVVLSQGALGGRIASRVYHLCSDLKGYDIVYKLHPSEFSRWQEYRDLLALAELPNVTIAKAVDLYELFARADYQIGVFSTAVYEGVGFGCKTLLLNLPGVEYMVELINNDNAVLIDSKADLMAALNDDIVDRAFVATNVFGSS